MGKMNEVNGLLILAGIGGKRRGMGGSKKTSGASVKKIPPRSKIKKGRGEIKKYMPLKIEERSGTNKGNSLRSSYLGCLKTSLKV